LHWSLTQFTPASMEVFPSNLYERIFSISIIFLSVLLLSSVVGSVTSLVTRMRMQNMDKVKEQETVREYLTQKRISLELEYRIFNFINTNKKARMPLKESDITLFKAMPVQLRMDLRCEVFLPPLQTHALFHRVICIDSVSASVLCDTAMAEVYMDRNQELYSVGQTGHSMYFIKSGRLEYSAHRGSYKEVLEGVRWFCEVVLWIKWELRGTIVGLSKSELVSLSSSHFRDLAHRLYLFSVLKEYAKQFLESLQFQCNAAHVETWHGLSPENVEEAFENSAGELQHNESQRGFRFVHSRWLSASRSSHGDRFRRSLSGAAPK